MCLTGDKKRDANCHRLGFVWYAAIAEIIFVVLFAAFTDYSDGALPTRAATVSKSNDLDHYYPLYQDVHVMIFIGFGFLMTFLQKYGFSSVGYNFLIAAFTIQWAMLINGFMHGAFEQWKPKCPEPMGAGEITRWCIPLDIKELIKSDFAAGAVLITFGAVLGKTTPLQMLVIATVELVFYSLNENIGAGNFGAVDMGGSIFVHTFGAYFGLALSWVISSSKDGTRFCEGNVVAKERVNNGSNYHSDMFAMIGTLFLWMFWPSFNGALATDEQQHRVVINTVLALSACCVSAFAADLLLRKNHKFDMESIQNATLAGGVAVGSSSDLVIQPWGAIVIGMVAGVLSVVGYVYVTPALHRCGLDDTCGVHNLHGMPGIMGAIGGAISASLAGDMVYGDEVGTVFPARANGDRTAGEQAAYQIAALAVTLLFAIAGGVLTGFIVKIPFLLYSGPIKGQKGRAEWYSCVNLCHANDSRMWYDDSYYWEVPEEDENKEIEAEEVNE